MKYNLIKTAIVASFLFAAPQAFAVCKITPEQDQNGDGYDNELVDVSARISADSEILCDNRSTVGENTRIVNWSTVEDSTIASDSRLNNTASGRSTIASEINSRDSRIEESTITIDDNVRLINSRINCYSSVKNGSVIRDSNLYQGKISTASRVIPSKIEGSKIGADAKIIDVR